MAALTKPYRASSTPETRFQSHKLSDGVTFYHGGLYALDPTSGRLIVPTGAATEWLVGTLVLGGADTANAAGAIPLAIVGDTSLSPDQKVTIDAGALIFEDLPVAGAAAITDVGDEVYWGTDNPEDATLTPTADAIAKGRIIGFNSSTSFRVLKYPSSQY